MLAGSLYAGIAFSYARLGNVHAMAHPLSGYFNIAHGVANAVLLPVVLEYNQSMNPDKYEKIYHYMFPTLCSVFKPKEFIQEIRNLLKELEIPLNLSELGVTEDKIDAMSIDAMKSGNVLVNPRTNCKVDIVRLYYEALYRFPI